MPDPIGETRAPSGPPYIVSPKDGLHESTTRYLIAYGANLELNDSFKKAKARGEDMEVKSLQIETPNGMINTFIPTKKQIADARDSVAAFREISKKLRIEGDKLTALLLEIDNLEKYLNQFDISGNSNPVLKESLSTTKDNEKLYAVKQLEKKLKDIREELMALQGKVNQIEPSLRQIAIDTQTQMIEAIRSPASEVHPTVLKNLNSDIFTKVTSPNDECRKKIVPDLRAKMTNHIHEMKAIAPDRAKRDIELKVGRIESEINRPE